MKIIIKNHDPTNEEIELGMIMQVQAVNRNYGYIYVETDSDCFIGGKDYKYEELPEIMREG